MDRAGHRYRSGVVHRPRRRGVENAPAVGWTAVTLVASALVALLALSNVEGVRPAGAGHDIEFVNAEFWALGLLLVAPVHRAARSSGWLGPAAVLVAVGPQFLVAHVTVSRYVDSGWASGGEQLSYLFPLAEVVVFSAAAVAGVLRHTGRGGYERAARRHHGEVS